jgi:hypothetical protein
MRPILAAAFACALLAPAVPASAAITDGFHLGSATTTTARPLRLALNPQPEPPGRGKIKRIYSGGPDSRRTRNLQKLKGKPGMKAPAAKP